VQRRSSMSSDRQLRGPDDHKNSVDSTFLVGCMRPQSNFQLPLTTPLLVGREGGQWLAADADAALMQSQILECRYWKAVPFRQHHMIMSILYLTRSGTSSQWTSACISCIRLWSHFQLPLTTPLLVEWEGGQCKKLASTSLIVKGASDYPRFTRKMAVTRSVSRTDVIELIRLMIVNMTRLLL